MATHVMFETPESVKRNFERCNYPFYTVNDSKGEIIWLNDSESNIDAAAEMLFEDLKTIREFNSAVYTIKHFKNVPKTGFKKTNEADCISTFKKGIAAENRMEFIGQRNDFNSSLLSEIREMRNEIGTLKMQLDSYDNEDLDDEKIEQQMQPTSLINGLLGNPQVQTTLINFLTNISANLFTPKIQNMQPMALAGTEQNDTIELILERLSSKGVTLEDLQKLSNFEPQKMQMLLGMLRSM